MKFQELSIPGVWLIEAEPFVDERGVFRRNFCAKEFAEHGINPNVAQANISENPHQWTLRGFHYQADPYGEDKTFSPIRGAIWDIVVDLRPKSPTYMEWVGFNIAAKDRTNLHVPAGCANAWLTREPNTVVHYYVSAPYVPEAGCGIRWNDSAFNFPWPDEQLIISDQDRNWPDFKP